MSYPKGSRRYRLVRLRDGRIHATDNLNPRIAYLLTPRPTRRSAYSLARAGEIRIESGRVIAVSRRAATSAYRVTRDRVGTVRVIRSDDPRWQITYSPAGVANPRDRFAVMDLRDGGLLLLDEGGFHELAIQATLPLDRGALQGDPDYEQFDDFAP